MGFRGDTKAKASTKRSTPLHRTQWETMGKMFYGVCVCVYLRNLCRPMSCRPKSSNSNSVWRCWWRCGRSSMVVDTLGIHFRCTILMFRIHVSFHFTTRCTRLTRKYVVVDAGDVWRPKNSTQIRQFYFKFSIVLRLRFFVATAKWNENKWPKSNRLSGARNCDWYFWVRAPVCCCAHTHTYSQHSLLLSSTNQIEIYEYFILSPANEYEWDIRKSHEA